MKKGTDKILLIVILAGILIALIILIIILIPKSPNGKITENTGFSCDTDLNNVRCASDYDCNSVNGICDLNSNTCVPSNINFALHFTGTEADCNKIKSTIAQGIPVECTSNAPCIQKYGEGYVCDLTPSNWGNCKKT